jgi:hypothetical protein
MNTVYGRIREVQGLTEAAPQPHVPSPRNGERVTRAVFAVSLVDTLDRSADRTIDFVFTELGNEEHPMKGAYTRLTRPLVRKRGVLREASWDEALDRAAEGFRATVERYGPWSFGLFSCSKATNEVNYLAQKFARGVLGSNNIDSCNRT